MCIQHVYRCVQLSAPSELCCFMPMKNGDNERCPARLNLPARRTEDSYLKVFVTGGTIARREGQL